MLKKYATGLIAMLIAVITFAFTEVKDSLSPSAGYYYNSALGSNQRLPANYTAGSISCGLAGPTVCTIQATDNGFGKPVFPSGTNPVDNPSNFSTITRQ